MNNFKLSKYNFFQSRKDGVVILNLYSKYVFAIEREEYEKLMSFEDNLDALKENDPILFSAMLSLGVIQNIHEDIPNILLMRNREAVFSDEFYRLTINPTLNCNFSCWYCYETHTKENMSDSVKLAIMNFVDKIIVDKRIQHLRVDWFGGEPLIAFNNVMKPLSEHFVEMCLQNKVKYTSSITTNASLINAAMIPFFEKYNISQFQITLDGGREIHNTIRFSSENDDSYSKIVSNICLLLNSMKHIELVLRINYTQDSLASCKNIINDFPIELRRRISVRLVRVWQDREDPLESHPEESVSLADFEKERYSVSKSFRISNHKAFSCYADMYNQAVINYDGRVFKCTTGDFLKIKEDGILQDDGEIAWNSNSRAKRVARATFDNPICLVCEILPSCCGGCSQHPVMHEEKNKISCPFKGPYLKQIEKILSSFELVEKDLTSIGAIERLL